MEKSTAAVATRTRLAQLRYIERVLQGRVVWHNSVHIIPRDHYLFTNEKRKSRALLFFHYGLSLGSLLAAFPADTLMFVRGLAQLTKEFHHYVKNTGRSSSRAFAPLRAPEKHAAVDVDPLTCCTEGSTGVGGEVDQNTPNVPAEAKIYTSNGTPLFAFLHTPTLGTPVDYLNTLQALMAILIQVYEKLERIVNGMVDGQGGGVGEPIGAVDGVVGKEVVAVVSVDLQKTAKRMVKRTLKAFKAFCRGGGGGGGGAEEGGKGGSSASFVGAGEGGRKKGGGAGSDSDSDDSVGGLEEDVDIVVDDEEEDEEDGESGEVVLLEEDEDVDGENASESVRSARERLDMLERQLTEFAALEEDYVGRAKGLDEQTVALAAHARVLGLLQEHDRTAQEALTRAHATETPESVTAALVANYDTINVRLRQAETEQAEATDTYTSDVARTMVAMKAVTSQRAAMARLPLRIERLARFIATFSDEDEMHDATDA